VKPFGGKHTATQVKRKTKKKKEMMMSERKSLLVALAFAVAAALFATAAAAPCDCQGGCRTVLGRSICYTEGGRRCPWARRSMLRPGQAWIYCPARGGAAAQAQPQPQSEIQSGCTCQEEGCSRVLGREICYTTGSCDYGQPSRFRPGQTWIDCPSGGTGGEVSSNDGTGGTGNGAVGIGSAATDTGSASSQEGGTCPSEIPECCEKYSAGQCQEAYKELKERMTKDFLEGRGLTADDIVSNDLPSQICYMERGEKNCLFFVTQVWLEVERLLLEKAEEEQPQSQLPPPPPPQQQQQQPQQQLPSLSPFLTPPTSQSQSQSESSGATASSTQTAADTIGDFVDQAFNQDMQKEAGVSSEDDGISLNCSYLNGTQFNIFLPNVTQLEDVDISAEQFLTILGVDEITLTELVDISCDASTESGAPPQEVSALSLLRGEED